MSKSGDGVLRVRKVLVLTVLMVLAVLALPQVLNGQAPAAAIDPRIVKLIDSISEQRMQQLLEKLVGFGTRNTLSDQASPTRGIGAARQWIYDELKRTSPKLQVSFDTHQIPARARITRDVELRNVMAVLPGKTPRRIYVSGHYDSLNLGSGGQQSSNSGAGRGGVQTRPGAAPQAPGEPAAAPNPPAGDPQTLPARTTTAAVRCCRWSSRACSPRAGSSSTPRSSS
jgi:hypothetical protein